MPDTTPNAAAIVPRRSSYRLHLSTWLILCFGLIIAIIIDLPGNDVPDLEFAKLDHLDYRDGVTPTLTLRHGWPISYAFREVEWPPEPPTTVFATVWNPTSQSQGFRVWALVFDAGLAFGAVAALVALFERRRRRTQRLQFRLRTLLIAVTVMAIAFGWWHRQQEQDKQLRAQLIALLEKDPNGETAIDSDGAEPISSLPLWVRVAIGEERSAALGINEPSVNIVYWSPTAHEHIRYLVERFPKCVLLNFPAAALESEQDWKKISELTNLAAISLDRMDDETMAHLDGFTRLEFLSTRRLYSSTGQRHQVTDAGLAHLRKHPNLEYLDIVARGITPRGLENLSGLPRLQTLCIDSTIVDESVISVLGRLPQLKRLEIFGELRTANAAQLQASLRQSRPHCEIVTYP